MLLFVVASCYAKFEPCQTFWANNSQHFLCSVIAETCAIMLDPFAQLSQHCWCHVRTLHMLSKVLWLLSLPRCTVAPNIVGNCCIRLHTIANTNATTPNKAGSCSIRLRVANTNTRNSQLLRQLTNSWNQENVCIKYLIPHSLEYSARYISGKYPQSKD